MKEMFYIIQAMILEAFSLEWKVLHQPVYGEVTQVTHDLETPLVVIGSTTESFQKTASLASPVTPVQVRGTESGDAEVTQVTLDFEEFGP